MVVSLVTCSFSSCAGHYYSECVEVDDVDVDCSMPS